MGWFLDDPSHEGYVVGVVRAAPGSSLWRELSYREDRERIVPRGGMHVEAFQVGCDCGWRSRRFVAPLGATWSPSSLELADVATEEAARRLWREHYDAEVKATRPAGLYGDEAHGMVCHRD